MKHGRLRFWFTPQIIPRNEQGWPQWAHISDFNIPDVNSEEPRFREIEIRPGCSAVPDCVFTSLGWSLQGSGAPEMFHQVRVPVYDQSALRFLWTNSLTAPPEEYKWWVHIFGATSSPCCANYALRSSALDNAGKFSPLVINPITRSFYVDDLLLSVGTETAISLAQEL